MHHTNQEPRIRGAFPFSAPAMALSRTNNKPIEPMKMTKDQCPVCGDFSTVRYSDGSYECLNCRHVTYDTDPMESYVCESWLLPASQVADFAVSLCSPSKATQAVPQPAVEEQAGIITLHDFESVCGVSPMVEVVKETYANGGIALQLWDDDGPLLTATQWIPGIPAGCVAIKDYDENAGCLTQLIRHGVIAPPHLYLDGYPICRVLF
jgi:ribosomal protein L37AE/L43A